MSLGRGRNEVPKGRYEQHPHPVRSKVNLSTQIVAMPLFATFIFSHLLMSKVSLEHLRCEYQIDPLGIDTKQPRLSWWLKSNSRGATQSAYQILVASSVELLKQDKGDLWDSGKVKSDASIQVEYQGKPLSSQQKCYWKARVWDSSHQVGSWSKPGSWTMGLLVRSDWKGKWIQQRVKQTFVAVDPFSDIPAPLFRKEFTVDKPVASAVLTMTGLGYFEPRLNGAKVGDHQLDPGWTDFAKRISYQTFDVTRNIKSGANALGVMLGNGFYNPLPLKMWGHLNLREHLAIGEPKMIAQLDIRFKDGSSQTVVSDESWRIAEGPVVRNSVYLGEVYDARREIDGWDKPGFKDQDWETPVVVPPANDPMLASQRTPPIRITSELKPFHISQPKKGVYIVDFGQNFAGVVRMRVRGAAGTRVRLRSGELLYPDGTLNGMTSVTGQHKDGGKDYVYDGKGEPKTAFQLDEYILKGKGVETFQPRFTFHGFRYVEVTGYPGVLTAEAFDGLRMNSDVEKVGSFECSNEMFNRIQHMVEWTLLSNLFSVQSDCPHREKFGYGGDQVATSEMAMFTYDMSRFYSNAVDMLAEAQRPNGGFTETAPFVGIADEGLGEGSGPVGWGTASPLLSLQLRQYYGDKLSSSKNFESALAWARLLGKSAPNSILDNGISDHESLVTKPRALTGTAFYFENLVCISYMFRLPVRVSETLDGDSIPTFDQVRSAFNAHFLDRTTGTYDTGTQCCQAMPLALGLVPEDMKAKVLDVLIKAIEAHDYHLTTGIFGTKYLFQALSNAGRDDVAYRVANQRTFPGWGFMLEKGATTLWEHWEFSDNTFSHNHPMFGSVSEWFYKSLAGIQPDPYWPDFKEFLIKPSIVGDLTWVKCHHDTMYGRIESNWRRDSNKLTMEVTVPPNTSATVIVPGKLIDPDGATVVLVPGHTIRPNRASTSDNSDKSSTLAISSGTYRFVSNL